MDKDNILKRLHAQVNVNGHIIGAVVGSGLTAKFVTMGGADILLALSAGKYRMMGRSSFSSYFCYENNNAQVMELGKREIFPIVRNVPLLFGLMASDPFIKLYDYLLEIRRSGFAGIVNFPTISLIDGQFRAALEAEGTTFDREVAAISLANHFGMFTMAFVTNAEETRQMIDAGANVICVHLGLTKGGYLGAKGQISVEEARRLTEKIFAVCKEVNPYVLRMVYAGPANTPADMQYLYQNTECQGYIGGSTFDRIPMESAILETTRLFKSYDATRAESTNTTAQWNIKTLIDSVRRHIAEHYAEEILLSDLALVSNVSASYLSGRFKKEVGISFTEYLLRYRLNVAKELLSDKNLSCQQAAERVGYDDYAQFSKMFKKYIGVSPANYKKSCN